VFGTGATYVGIAAEPVEPLPLTLNAISVMQVGWFGRDESKAKLTDTEPFIGVSDVSTWIFSPLGDPAQRVIWFSGTPVFPTEARMPT
jgi:hypothetical protein